MTDDTDDFFWAVINEECDEALELHAPSPNYGNETVSRVLTKAAKLNRVDVLDRVYAVYGPMNIDQMFNVLTSTVYKGATDAVRWLLEHDFPVNTREGCTNLTSAAMDGQLEIAKLLVKHGGDLNGSFGLRDTPYETALQNGHHEVAEFLKPLCLPLIEERDAKAKAHNAVVSTGAKEETEVSPEPRVAPHLTLLNHFTQGVGATVEPLSLQQILPTGIDISIYAASPTDEFPFLTLFTSGMSNYPMQVPAGTRGLARAELFMTLLPNWNHKDLENRRWSWPYEWLLRIAQYPSKHDGFIGAPLSFYAYGDPPRKVVPEREFTSLLVFPHGTHMSTEGPVAGMGVMPAFEQERRYEQQHGASALLDVFMETVPFYVDVDRKSAV